MHGPSEPGRPGALEPGAGRLPGSLAARVIRVSTRLRVSRQTLRAYWIPDSPGVWARVRQLDAAGNVQVAAGHCWDNLKCRDGPAAAAVRRLGNGSAIPVVV